MLELALRQPVVSIFQRTRILRRDPRTTSRNLAHDLHAVEESAGKL